MAPFNKYDPALNNRELDALDMDQVIHTIQRQAPLLLQLIRDLMAPESWQNIQCQKEPVAQIVMIISILCFSQHRSTYTGFQTILGLYLHSKGMKHQQIELLSKLGLLVSYDTIIRVIKAQSNQATEQVKCMGQSNTSVIAADNFEVKVGLIK